MLPPDSRTTLLRQLEPPPGAKIEHLVGTTFTLDLESALLPCLALAGSANADKADAVETVAAIRASIGKVDIFHQVGHIGVPQNRSPLYSLLEDSIHGIGRTKGLFHPKLWLGAYRGEGGEEIYRLIILSRNLTKDRSWDVALSLDGQLTNSRIAGNAPLQNLLDYLLDASATPIDGERRARLTDLGKRLQKVKWELPARATDIAFHVYGLPRRTKPTPDFSGYKHLLVSPFLNDAGLQHLTEGRKGPLTVVSRQEALNCLSEDAAESVDTAYVVSANAGLPGEEDDSSTLGSTLLDTLHAKLYAVERSKVAAHLFIGSANATDAAFNRNVEILVELTGPPKLFGVDALVGGEGFGPILELAEIESDTAETDEEQEDLDRYVRTIAGVSLVATLSRSDDEGATLAVTSEEPLPTFDADVSLSLSLLTVPSKQEQVLPASPVDVVFGDLKLSDVTAFVVIEAQRGGRRSRSVVKAELIGDDSGRLDSIVTDQLDGPEAFRRLLALILAFGGLPTDQDGALGETEGAGTGNWSQYDQGLFELIMRSSVSNREGLEYLAGIVCRSSTARIRTTCCQRDLSPSGRQLPPRPT